MWMKIELWIIFLSVSCIVAVSKHKRVNKCTQPGGCGRRNAMHASAMTAAVSKQQSHRKPIPFHSTIFGRLSLRQSRTNSSNASSVGVVSASLKTKMRAVRSLADNIIKELIIKEASFGIHIKEYMDSITVALSRLRILLITWTGETPDIQDFLDGVSLALDDLTIASPDITDDLIRVRDLESDQPALVIKSTRWRFNYKSFKRPKQISSTLPPRKNSKKRKGYAKIEESHWWRPIVRLKEHLKYSDLWMKFLEELNSKLEAAETQLRRNELSMDFELMGYTIENVTDVFKKINRNFELTSLRNITGDIIATANANRLKYLDQIIRINLLTNRTCVEMNNIAYAVAPFLTIGSAKRCCQSLAQNNSQINAVAIIGVVRFFLEQIMSADALRNSSLEFGKGFHMISISPEWITLSSDEPDDKRNIFIGGRQPPDYSSESKTQGEAGLPGEEGGSFYAFGSYVRGIGMRIYNGGGQGGTGQDGGVKSTCQVGCFEEEMRNSACCWRRSRFFFPGVNGGLPGLGADPGEYRLILFTNASRTKFDFRQSKGSDGKGGLGHDYYRLKDGDTPDLDTLKNSGINCPSLDVCLIAGFCAEEASQIIKFPLSDADDKRLKGKDQASTAVQKPPQKISFGPEKSVPAILIYKQWSLRYSHLFNTRRLRAFASKSDMDDEFQSLLTTTDLIEEFTNLEKEAQADYLDIEVLKLSYQSIAYRAQLRAQNYTGENKEDNIKVLLFLSSAARSKMLAITNPYEPILVVDMLNFLSAEKSRVGALQKEVEEELQYQHITDAVASYNQMILDHFKEADFLINNTINPEFAEIEMKMTQLVQSLLKIIRKLKEDEDNNREALKKYRDMLVSHQTGNLVSNLLKLGGNVLAFFYPAAGAISVGVDYGNAIFNPKPEDPGVKPAPVPEAVNSGSMASALSFRKSTDYNLKGFTRQLKAVGMTVETERQYFPNTLKVLGSMSTAEFLRAGGDVETPIDSFPPADCAYSFKLLMTTQGMIRQGKLNLSVAIQLDLANALNESESATRISNATKENIKKTAKVAKIVADGVSSTYNQWTQDQDHIDEVSKAIEESEKRSMAYQRHIDKIENELLPEIDMMFKGLSDVRQDLADLSSLALIVVRHTLQKTIKNAQLDYKKEYVAGTGLEDYFDRALQSTLDAMETLINIYERLDAYKEQGKLANFTAEVALNPKQYLGKLKDPEMQKKFDELRYTLQGEVLLKRQSLVEGAFRMWKFPMVDPVLCDYQNLSATALDFSTTEKVHKFLDDMEKRIDNLIDVVKVAQSSVVPGDEYTLITEFTRKERSYPFFKWENATSSEFIADMLKGRRTYLRSKESPGVPICEAVKFKRVSLSFGSSVGDQALEDEFKSVLNDYEVTLIHTGNSFYLFANESFAINSEKVVLTFTFELNEKGEPVTRNLVYEKLLNGDLTLSPYTTWLITVKPRDPSGGFEPLAKFSRQFDLYLEGAGRCVKKSFATEGKYVSPTCEDF